MERGKRERASQSEGRRERERKREREGWREGVGERRGVGGIRRDRETDRGSGGGDGGNR